MSQSKIYQLDTEPNITFNATENSLLIAGEEHHLEPLQSRMLLFFIEHKGEVVNTQEIASAVWDRTEVSDNLVRQVISLLRTFLHDKKRPYTIIKTIPKQGYIFDVDVTEIKLVTEISKPKVKFKNRKTVSFSIFSLVISFFIAVYLIISTFDPETEKKTMERYNAITPVIFNAIALDNNAEYAMAKSVYEYVYFGLNSSKNIIGYRGEHLSNNDKEQFRERGYILKSWLKRDEDIYDINLTLQFYEGGKLQLHKFDKSFSKESFFTSVGDLILEVKTYINSHKDDYNISNHRITSIKNYSDWEIIAKGISLFYQGKGASELKAIEQQLKSLKEQGRQYYLLDSLNSYISTMKYLSDGNEENKVTALRQAEQAFERNPRCNIANTTLGMALLLNKEVEKAYPYLFFAAESSPSPLNYYLLSVADEQADNSRGAEYNYQRFAELNKEGIGQIQDIQAYLQNPNLSKPTTKELD